MLSHSVGLAPKLGHSQVQRIDSEGVCTDFPAGSRSSFFQATLIQPPTDESLPPSKIWTLPSFLSLWPQTSSHPCLSQGVACSLTASVAQTWHGFHGTFWRLLRAGSSPHGLPNCGFSPLLFFLKSHSSPTLTGTEHLGRNPLPCPK